MVAALLYITAMTRGARPRAVLSGAVTALVLLVGVAAPPARAADGTGQPALTQEAPRLQAQLQAQLDSLVAKGAPGALAVVGDGRTALRLASGVARVEPRQPMRPNARFRVGSVTKTFVATVALQLVQDGRLRLDDTVERWLPGVVPNGQAITVRMLLNQRAVRLHRRPRVPAAGHAEPDEAGDAAPPRRGRHRAPPAVRGRDPLVLLQHRVHRRRARDREG